MIEKSGYMKYCSNCGKQLSGDDKFCPLCGKDTGIVNQTQPTTKVSPQPAINNTTGIVCPKCHSSNVDVQMISINQQRGCLSIFLYLILAITIIGIPIMIFLLIARGQKSSMRKLFVCKNCGYSYGGGSSSPVALIIAIVAVVVMIGVIGGVNSMNKKKEDNSNKNYTKLDLKTMHSDYKSNEIAAKDKYVDKYYYYSGKIDEIVEYHGSYYLAFCNNNGGDKICLYTYFDNTDEIKTLKKGDSTTVYCKCNGYRSEDYSYTYYAMNKCTLKAPATTTKTTTTSKK